jgi:hypothetical protein
LCIILRLVDDPELIEEPTNHPLYNGLAWHAARPVAAASSIMVITAAMLPRVGLSRPG